VASFTLREVLTRNWIRAGQVAVASCAVIVTLEIPYVLNLLLHSERGTTPGVVVNSVSYTLTHLQSLRPAASLGALIEGSRFILLRPWTSAWFGPFLMVCAVVTAVRFRREVTVLSATVLPLTAAVAGFSFWQLAFDNYWFLVVAPSAMLTIGLAVTAWRPAASSIAVALAVAAVCAQPSRVADAMTIHRLPEYGPLARGSMEIRRRASEIRRIDTDLVLPPSTDRGFLYETLGGRITRDGRFMARIDRAGDVTFTPVRDGS
jgi:hypothetical protein